MLRELIERLKETNRFVVRLHGEGLAASYLDDLFTIRNGGVVATDVARVLAALGAYTAPIILRVAASDRDDLVYYGTVAFRIE